MNAGSSTRCGRLAAALALAGSLAFFGQAQAQPTITSTVPANGATGVSTSAPVVFTFSAAMDTGGTSAFFYDNAVPIPNIYATTPAWSAGNTVLTCTPSPGFAANKTINWAVSGQGADTQPLGGIPFGTFTTGSGGGGGGGGGTGTNAITSFGLGITHLYHQTSTSTPTLDTNVSYLFQAITSLSSNRTATNIQFTLPTASVSNLVQNPFAHENYSLFAFDTNLTAFNTTFPSGNYTFKVQSVDSNQTVIVNFPSSLQQPAAPHLTNYTAAQAVNPAQPLVLGWDAFPGGGSTDFVYVVIGSVFSSTSAGSPGALPGTATSITIPAGTLQASSNYNGSIGFYRWLSTTNGSNYVTAVYRGTVTDFTLFTTGSGPLVLTNAAFVPANFSFDVLCSAGQTVTVEYRTNLTAGQWQTLLTTNSPGSRFRSVAPQSTTNRALYFRARNGS